MQMLQQRRGNHAAAAAPRAGSSAYTRHSMACLRAARGIGPVTCSNSGTPNTRLIVCTAATHARRSPPPGCTPPHPVKCSSWSCVTASGWPAAMRSMCSTRSCPVMASVMGCSTCWRVGWGGTGRRGRFCLAGEGRHQAQQGGGSGSLLALPAGGSCKLPCIQGHAPSGHLPHTDPPAALCSFPARWHGMKRRK